MAEKKTTIPRMVHMDSSNIAAIGHDKATSELHVRYKGGGHYIHAGVPEGVYHQALGADSIGKFLSASVKSKYAARKHN